MGDDFRNAKEEFLRTISPKDRARYRVVEVYWRTLGKKDSAEVSLLVL